MKVFLDNKYTLTYERLIEQAKSKGRKRGKGHARHHIIPAHFYIDNKRKEKEEAALTSGWLPGNPDEKDNLVYLTHREHLVCHLLLRKMIEEEKRAGVIYAAWRMANYELEDGSIIKLNSRLYDKIRTEVSDTHSKTMKGRPAHNKGKKVTDKEKLDNIKTAAQERDKVLETCEHCGKTLIARAIKQYHGDKCEMNPNRDPNIVTVKTRGLKRTEEQKERMVAGMTGVKKGPMSESEKKKRSDKLSGIPKSDETRANMKKRAEERMKDGTHPNKIRVSCIVTRKEYSLPTFTRYVINGRPGPNAKKR